MLFRLNLRSFFTFLFNFPVFSSFLLPFPHVSLCRSRVSFNEWTPLLLGLAACLQLWMKLSGVFGMAPVFGLSF